MARYAPDLTHLMSRETLASGIVENTPETLADWVRDPQTIKPGCLMPAFGLDDRKQQLIVDYLRRFAEHCSLKTSRINTDHVTR